MLSLVPLAIVGALSEFQGNKSTSVQRGFTMSWLIVGIVYGSLMAILFPLAPMWEFSEQVKPIHITKNFDIIICGIVIFYGLIAIGGMIVVGMMINDYGVCTLIK